MAKINEQEQLLPGTLAALLEESGYRVPSGVLEIILKKFAPTLTPDELDYLSDHAFIGIREDVETHERPVKIEFRTWLRNDEKLSLRSAVRAAIEGDDDWNEERVELRGR